MACARFKQLLQSSGKLVKRSYIADVQVTSCFQTKCWSSTSAVSSPSDHQEGNEDQPVKLSKAMKAYQERAHAHEAFMFEQVGEYEIGKRHLANIMGEDPETFSEEHIEEAIKYLFPSGLFEPKARPMMKHPDKVFAKRKDAEFDEAGRPHHTLFYTGVPGYYQVLHDLVGVVRELDHFSERMMRYSVHQNTERTLNAAASEWVTKLELETILFEKFKDKHYEFFISSMNRLLDHPYSYRAREFIMRFRKPVSSVLVHEEIPKLLYTAEGVPYMAANGTRKRSIASVTVYGRGSGKITINGETILYFKTIQGREQVLFPLQFTEVLDKTDVVADVEGGGPTGQAGAIRFAISKALRSFVDKDTLEKMRLAGLLTRDLRTRERKKPGQKGARAKYTWKKR